HQHRHTGRHPHAARVPRGGRSRQPQRTSTRIGRGSIRIYAQRQPTISEIDNDYRSVRGRGLEPPLLSEPDPKSGASTSSAILARIAPATLAGGRARVTGQGDQVPPAATQSRWAWSAVSPLSV